MIITKEIAKKILEKRQIITKEGVYSVNHRISNTIMNWPNRVDEETGEEVMGEPYKIINTDAISLYQAQQAKEHFFNQEYQEATNKNLTFNASLDLAEELESCMNCNILVEERTTKNGITGLFIAKVKPVKSTVSKTKFNFFSDEEIEESFTSKSLDAESPEFKAVKTTEEQLV
jgi:hypothetical protein